MALEQIYISLEVIQEMKDILSTATSTFQPAVKQVILIDLHLNRLTFV
jgi:hypothetical protein